MPRFNNFSKIGIYLIRKEHINIEDLLDKFLGLGVCKHCGYKHESILGYCENCNELAGDLGIKLYELSSMEFHIRRDNKIIERRKDGIPF